MKAPVELCECEIVEKIAETVYESIEDDLFVSPTASKLESSNIFMHFYF